MCIRDRGRPVEPAGVHDGAAHRVGMAVHVLGSGVGDNVGPPLEGAAVHRGEMCIRDRGYISRLAAEAYGYAIREPYDLEPEEEQHIGRYAKEVWGSDFVFVTHYPGRKRPFYTMDDPEDPRYTLSFDLLFRGMEITTGGQRIHNYGQQVEKLKARGMEPEDFSGYLLFHKHGAPPHGGLGIGLELSLIHI